MKLNSNNNAFVEGDLITAYIKGYHSFVKYESRGDNVSPLIHYKQRFTSNGIPRSGKVQKCDANYCILAKDDIAKSIEDFQDSITRLKKIYENI